MADAPAGASGFRLMLGPGGLDARLALMRGAQRSLDLQYYHLHDDATGRLVLRELRDAARRGVRVRLLLDDLYTDGLEPLLEGLDAYPNVEIHLFNPFPTRGSMAKRFAAAMLDFARLNRRMHNKLFVADGVLAVTGGRNLGDEYFMRGTQSNFFDFDMLVAGPVVAQMSSLFDEYWNAEQVRTAASVLRPVASFASLRQAFDQRVDGVDTPDPPAFRGLDRSGRLPVADELRAGSVRMVYGAAQAFADSPAKAWGERQSHRLPSGALLDNSHVLLTTEFRAAQHEIWLSSPYMVPGPEALEHARTSRKNGVRISLLTNSLAATDEPVVHTGYRRYRDNMLRAGVQIHELHPSLGRRLLLPGEVGSAPLRLHTKAAVIDRKQMFIGSVNMDPRSESLNTEFGLLAQSPELAAEAIGLLELLKQEASYQVRLKQDSSRDLEWVWTDERKQLEVIDTEPGSDPWTRLKLYIQSLLIPESLL
ncbi:phospholipase D family protein [Variovorax sp. KK3]|uniref:phospholipase D family protein n=1 Tax=Variovorax sp. KK3 TaxID=1855728 RepID=UPI0015C2E7D1|nr:phospholipase D family protein [Variovorax sp. KK3]